MFNKRLQLIFRDISGKEKERNALELVNAKYRFPSF